MRSYQLLALPGLLLLLLSAPGQEQAGRPWRSLPLIKDGKVHPDWTQIGWGGFAFDGGSLRTECDEKGMGLLLYKKEKLGNCQIRVVYKSKDARSNAGVFVRIDDGILRWLQEKPAPLKRDKGKLSEEAFKKLMADSEEERGPWYAVHHGYEVQICDESDEYHRTGAIYSLAKAVPAPQKRPTEWKTMIITLKGNLVLVDIDDKRVTTFDPDGKDVPGGRKWYEPKREPKRPQIGYIGLQNHDPGDVVYFKEVSVRPLEEGPAAAAADDAVKKEKQKLQGAWVVVAVEEDGKAVGEFSRDRFVFSAEKVVKTEGNGRVRHGSYTIDPTKKPKHIDTLFNDFFSEGVYQLEGDELKIGVRTSGQIVKDGAGGEKKVTLRPTSLDSKEGLLFIFKREKP